MKAQKSICLVTNDTPFAKGLKLFYVNHPEYSLNVCNTTLFGDIYDVVILDLDSFPDFNKSHVGNAVFVSDTKNRIEDANVVKKKSSALELSLEIEKTVQEDLRIRGFKTEFDSITIRESEILYHLSEGLSTREIAKLCEVSIGTINAHRLSIIQKYGAKNTANLVYTVLKKLKE